MFPNSENVEFKMTSVFSYLLIFVIAFLALPKNSNAQELMHLTLPEAIEAGIKNYPSVKVKVNYVAAARSLTRNARAEYLPNVIASAQNNYGTINGQFGPGAPIGVLGVASSGPVTSQQNWNAAFGALYIISTTWEAFTFGRVKSRIQQGVAQEKQNTADLELVESAKSNLERTQTIQQTVRARTSSGLNAGVDSTLANAEVSRAKLSLLDFVTNEQTVQRQLAEFLGISTSEAFSPDTTLFMRVPGIVNTPSSVIQNPQLAFYRTRIENANQVAKTIQKSIMPGVTLFGVYQARGSGFNYSYNPEVSNSYSRGYSDGTNPSRYNYVAGISLTWNLTSPVKIRQQVNAQRFIATGYQNE